MVRAHLNEFECGSRIMAKGIPSYTEVKVNCCFKKSKKNGGNLPPWPAVLLARLFELAQNFNAIHCDVTMTLNIGITILPDLN